MVSSININQDVLVHEMVNNFQFFLKIFYLGDTGHGWNWEEEDCFAGVGSFKALFDNIQGVPENLSHFVFGLLSFIYSLYGPTTPLI